MKSYRAGNNVVLTLQYLNEEGVAVTPESAKVIVQNAFSEILHEAVVTIEPSATEAVITVASEHNQLTAGEPRSARLVTLEYVIGGNTLANIERYLIYPAQSLIFHVNSFQTYEQAIVNTLGFMNLTGWDSASEDQRFIALEEAYNSLCKLNYIVREAPVGGLDSQSMLSGGFHETLFAGNISDLTATELRELPVEFINALAKAQIVETNVLLGGDSVAERRRDGLMSSTIGEVSQMFRPGKPLALPVSPQAARQLAGYINWSAKLGRG